MKFERKGDIKESMGIGRKANAVNILGLQYIHNSTTYDIPEHPTHLFLGGLEKGNVLLGVLNAYLPMTIFPFQDDDRVQIRFIVSRTQYVDQDGKPVIASIGLDDFRIRAEDKDVIYNGVLYAISNARLTK